MFVLRIFSVALATLWPAGAVSCSFKPYSCKKPAIRREWRALTTNQRAEWIRAVNCLSHLPHDPALAPSVFEHPPSIISSWIPPVNKSSSYYDDLVYIHMDLNIQIHWTGLFFPWHRWYVHVFEQSLKNKCGYTGMTPYWNWTIDAPNFYESSFWKDSDPVSGLGGWGDPNADFSVPDGGFNKLHLSYPSPHTVRRDFMLLGSNSQVPTFTDPLKELQATSSFSAAAIEAILETPSGDYKGFQLAFETFGGPHSAVHEIVGGDLAGTCPRNAPSNCTVGPKWTTNDPLFFLHHAMVDKVWSDWQHRDPVNAHSFFGGSVQVLESMDAWQRFPDGAPPYLGLNSVIPADGLFPEVTIGDVMNTTSGYLCYVYE